MNKIILTMTASLILMACGHINNKATANDSIATEATVTEQLDECWVQSAQAYAGVDIRVTDNGGVKLVWTDWDKFMEMVTHVIDATYPYDAPMKERNIEGLQGKVKALAVMGNPMSPFVYMLLEDNSVQLFSIYKMCSSWNFQAGWIIAHDVALVKDEIKDYRYTVLVDKNGKELGDDSWIIDGANLYSYYRDNNGLQVEYMIMGDDGSFSYNYSDNDNLDATPSKTYCGIVTKFERNGETLENVIEYKLTTLNTPDGRSENVNITGRFTLKAQDNAEGTYTIIPTQGLNMSAFTGEKLGQPHSMLVRYIIEKYLQ